MKPDFLIAKLTAALGQKFTRGGSKPSDGFDCAGYICWALREIGFEFKRLSAAGLIDLCHAEGQEINPEQALATPAALLFHLPRTRGTSGHVAISLGTGDETLEAVNQVEGVSRLRGPFNQVRFERAGLLPGIRYH